MRVDFQPGQIGRRHRLGDAFEALGLEVEIDVEVDTHVRANRLADRHQLLGHPARQPVVPIQFRPTHAAAEPRHVRGQRTIHDRNDIGLQGAEPASLHILGVAGKVVIGAQRRHAHQLRAAHPVGAEMRPIDRDAFADWAAEQRVDRHPIGLAGDVEQGVLDRRDRLLVNAAARLPGQDMQMLGDLLIAARVLADQRRRQPADHVRETSRAEALVKLRPADDAIVGRYLEEGEHPPAGIRL